MIQRFQDKTHLAFSVVVPLIATVGINGKVTFLEKAGTSEYVVFPPTTMDPV
jgi:hypothetical protein